MNRNKRRSTPTPLERILAGVLHDTGLTDTLAQGRALAAWENIVGGDIAAHSRAIALEGGILTLQADHGAWRQELTLLIPEIMARFNCRFGEGTITEIRWARPATSRRTYDNLD